MPVTFTGNLLGLCALNWTPLMLPGYSVPTSVWPDTTSGLADSAVDVTVSELLRLHPAKAAPAPPTTTTAAEAMIAERLVILRMGSSSWNGSGIALELRNGGPDVPGPFRRWEQDDRSGQRWRSFFCLSCSELCGRRLRMIRRPREDYCGVRNRVRSLDSDLGKRVREPLQLGGCW